MNHEPWQLQVFKKAIKKKEKLHLLRKNLPIKPGMIILDLGCAQGILSYYLRQAGGFWISADQDYQNLKTTQDLLKTGLVQVGPGILPFKTQCFDLVVSLDYLEHLEDDDQCLREINRVLKQNGCLILATPRTGKFLLLNKLRSVMGMKKEFYGHKREGYTHKGLEAKLRNSGFHLQEIRTFSRFFSEFMELLRNFVYIKLLSRSTQEKESLRDGNIRPSTQQEFSSQAKSMKIYSFIHPLVWLITKLDKILFFQKGYGLLVWATKINIKPKA